MTGTPVTCPSLSVADTVSIAGLGRGTQCMNCLPCIVFAWPLHWIEPANNHPSSSSSSMSTNNSFSRAVHHNLQTSLRRDGGQKENLFFPQLISFPTTRATLLSSWRSCVTVPISYPLCLLVLHSSHVLWTCLLVLLHGIQSVTVQYVTNTQEDGEDIAVLSVNLI